MGQFKLVGGPRFPHHNHEYIFHMTLACDPLALGISCKEKSNIAHRGHARALRCRGNIWFIPYDTVQRNAAKFHRPRTFRVVLPR